MKEDMSLSNLGTVALHAAKVPTNVFSSTLMCILTLDYRWYFFCGSFMVFLSNVCYAFVRVYLFVPCGHLLGKSGPLGSRFWCLL